MKITKLYSNFPKEFAPILFNAGLHSTAGNSDLLNVILAEFTDPDNFNKTSHNLGKSTLVQILDFVLLKEINKDHFLETHKELFGKFTFYLEVLLNSGKFLTIARNVNEDSKIDIMLHDTPYQDFSKNFPSDYTYSKIPISHATMLVDSLLDLKVIAPFSYRNGLSYFIRTQHDYTDLFQMSKFIGKHMYWKPYIWKIFGFNQQTMVLKYDYENEIHSLENQKKQMLSSMDPKLTINVLTESINATKKELKDVEKDIDNFSFNRAEEEINSEMLEEIEQKISVLNSDIYSLSYELRKSNEALSHGVNFNLDRIQTIFKEVNILFPEKIIKDYNELVDFNKRISKERNKLLKENIVAIEQKLEESKKEKLLLDKKRMERAVALSSSDSLKKYKALQKIFTDKKAVLTRLELKLEHLQKVAQLDRDIKLLHEKIDYCVSEFEKNTKHPSAIFTTISREFREMTKRVLDITATISFSINKEGNIDFKLNTFEEDNSGIPYLTSAANGNTFKKILCAIYDLAVLRAYSRKDFFHFVYHDGIMEALEPKKRQLLFDVIRETCDNFHIQYIFSLMECDRVLNNKKGVLDFQDYEIALKLNDSGEEGRLFKFQSF